MQIRGLKYTHKSIRLMGGEGSGFHGHSGRPGSVGGSAPSSALGKLEIDFSKKLAAGEVQAVRGQFASDKKALAEKLGMRESTPVPGTYFKSVEFPNIDYPGKNDEISIGIGTYASEGYVPRYMVRFTRKFPTLLGGGSTGGKFQFNNRQNWEKFTEYALTHSSWQSVHHLASELPS